MIASFRLAALYKFVHIESTEILQKYLEQLTTLHNIQGTLIVASEGLNGTIAGKPDDIMECIR